MTRQVGHVPPCAGFMAGHLVLDVERSAHISGTCVALSAARFSEWERLGRSLGVAHAFSVMRCAASNDPASELLVGTVAPALAL